MRSTPIDSADRRSTASEDYLKVVYGHTEWQDAPITSSQLAARLGLAPSSVTEMVKKLVAQGLVEHAPYGAIELTAEGRSQALRMVRRHRLIETWLVERSLAGPEFCQLAGIDVHTQHVVPQLSHTHGMGGT